MLNEIPSYSENKEQIELIMKCMGMTEEQMKADLSNGYYDIGTKQMPCLTGKGGFINFILGMQKKIKNI